ncbi:MAG: 4Fe-4S dicluster domain-containing protein [Methanomethylophilus sp.]|jgi:heterodisulfide reductase subunit B
MNEINAKLMDQLMTACIGCQRCRKVCPSHAHGGCDPYYVMKGWDGNVKMCIGCGKCSEICPSTDPKTVMMHLKAEALGLKIPDSYVKDGYVRVPADPSWKEGLPEIPQGDDMYMMPGCIVKGFLPYLQYAAARALDAVGVHFKELPEDKCCTYPLVLRSMTDVERLGVKARMHNHARGKEMFTLCSGCCNEFARSGIYAPHISTVLARYVDQIRKLPGVKFKVAIEPGCSAERFRPEIEAVVRACGAEPIGNKSGCCGKTIEGVSQELMAEREAECADADVIVMACPNCMRFYDKYPGGKPILHITELVALAAGDAETQRFHKIKIPAELLGTHA